MSRLVSLLSGKKSARNLTNKKLNLAFIYVRGSLFENSENPSKTENLHQNFKKPRLDFLNCTKVRNSSLIFITVNCYGAR